jgi:phosphopantothenoylcysteine decarboxylase
MKSDCIYLSTSRSQLRRWADIILIAPLSANTLAKLSNGICDNLLTSLMRALDSKRTDVLVFPAMNTHMWEHPFTAKQLEILQTLNYQVVGPVGKTLACGDIGEQSDTIRYNGNILNG